MMELKNIQKICYTVCCHVYTYIVGSEAKLGVVQRAFSTPGPRGVELFADFENLDLLSSKFTNSNYFACITAIRHQYKLSN